MHRKSKNLFIVMFCVACILVSGFQFHSTYATTSTHQPLDYSYTTKKQVSISSDPRIELISIMQMMIGAWPMTELEFDYLHDVQGTFFQYYGHPAIEMFSFMWYNYGFSQEIPSTFMLHLSNPPELKILTPFTKEITDKGGGDRNLNDFLVLLRDFAKQTNFIGFYHQHQGFYQECIEQVEKKLGTKNTIPMLEDYFGFSDRSHGMILVPLFSEIGYGTHVDKNYFALVGPYDVEEKKGDKNPYWAGPDDLHKQLLKSFSYAYINPLLFDRKTDILTTAKLFKPISTQMRYQKIVDWQSCLTEHIVRGVSQSFTLQEYGPEEHINQRNQDIQSFYVYIDYIGEWLRMYENHRNVYSNFEKFYPVIFNSIRQLCECPLIPTMVSVENVSENGVQIAWKDNTTEPGALLIYRKTLKKDYEIIHQTDLRDVSVWTDPNVTIGETYWYQIAIQGLGGTIRSYAVRATIPSYPPLAPENVQYEKEENSLRFFFSYSYKAEGFTLFEWDNGEKRPLQSISFEDFDPENENIYTIILEEHDSASDHLFFVCSYITVSKSSSKKERLYSSPSNFIQIEGVKP
ncbi:MAG: DUF4932 domain-containing protein [Caldisericia bacterium]|nr:DUF4932 domain-containing protein [Caldisericia bacterium]